MRCELASPVAVDDAILGKSIPPFGAHQRSDAKLGSHMIRHRIADLRAIEGVQNTAEIQLAISTAYLGNVSKNLCTRCIGVEVAPHQLSAFAGILNSMFRAILQAQTKRLLYSARCKLFSDPPQSAFVELRIM